MRKKSVLAVPGHSQVLFQRLPLYNPLAMGMPACVRCQGTGLTGTQRLCPCILRRLRREHPSLIEAKWIEWIEMNGGPRFPRSTLNTIYGEKEDA